MHDLPVGDSAEAGYGGEREGGRSRFSRMYIQGRQPVIQFGRNGYVARRLKPERQRCKSANRAAAYVGIVAACHD